MARAFVRRRMSISTATVEEPPPTPMLLRKSSMRALKPNTTDSGPPMLSKTSTPPMLAKKSSMRSLLSSDPSPPMLSKKSSMRSLLSSDSPPMLSKKSSMRNLKSSVRNLFAARTLEDDPFLITPAHPIRVRIRFPEPCESPTVVLVPRHDVAYSVHLASTGFAQDAMSLAFLEHGPLASGKGLAIELPDASLANIDTKIDAPVSGSAGYFWETIITAAIVRVAAPPPESHCVSIGAKTQRFPDNFQATFRC